MCLVKQCIDDYDYVKLCERKVSVGKMSAMVIPPGGQMSGGRCRRGFAVDADARPSLSIRRASAAFYRTNRRRV